MEVYEIINTKVMFENETNPNYYVIYEETLNRNVILSNNRVIEMKKQHQKEVNLFKGNGKSSLLKVQGYPINQGISFENVKDIIKSSYPDVFLK